MNSYHKNNHPCNETYNPKGKTMTEPKDTPEEKSSEVDPTEPISTRTALKVLWKNGRTPLIVGLSAIAGAIIYARATAEPSEDQDDILDVLEITEVDPTE